MSPVAPVKTLKIDGRDLSGRQEETILDVARQNGIFIPRLCEMDGLTDVGACRLCLVEIKGQNKLLPACVTVVEEGMEVTTDSERLQGYRRMILELLFTERNHVCAVCVSNGHCEMQMLAQRLGITHVHFPVSLSEGRSRRVARSLCHRPQSLHPVYPVRARMRRN